jgi:hypothetical protein
MKLRALTVGACAALVLVLSTSYSNAVGDALIEVYDNMADAECEGMYGVQLDNCNTTFWNGAANTLSELSEYYYNTWQAAVYQENNCYPQSGGCAYLQAWWEGAAQAHSYALSHLW